MTTTRRRIRRCPAVAEIEAEIAAQRVDIARISAQLAEMNAKREAEKAKWDAHFAEMKAKREADFAEIRAEMEAEFAKMEAMLASVGL